MPTPENTTPPSDRRREKFRGCELDASLEMELRWYLPDLVADIDIEPQLIAVYGLLAKTKEADVEITKEIQEWEEHAKTLSDEDAQQHAEGQWIDCLHQATYHGAAHSMAALGMLAPLLETVFHQYLRAICQKLTELGAPLVGHPRWTGEPDKAGDCHLVWENNRFRKDLVLGVEQLASALGLTDYLPADYKQVLDALFLYRNKMFHHGFEWPMEERRAFEQTIGDKCFPIGWFSKATSGDEPMIFYMSETMISKVIATIDGVLDGIARYARDRVTPLLIKRDYLKLRKEVIVPTSR